MNNEIKEKIEKIKKIIENVCFRDVSSYDDDFEPNIVNDFEVETQKEILYILNNILNLKTK